MIRKIFVPQNGSITLPIPQEYIGKELEIIAFPKEEAKEEFSVENALPASGSEHDVRFPDSLQPNQRIDNKLTIVNLYI
ncbi:hypothetical protein FACS1894181_02950 [Bacteroidia bacterium]|nr:hypothetical protein FACS1894181_02950 [Bacteroidia bacterium]